MSKTEQLSTDHRIDKALLFLKNSQLDDGSFKSHSSSNLQFQDLEEFLTTFYPSLILCCLSSFDDKVSSLVKHKTLQFLQKEKSSIGTFNYWSKSFFKYKEEPYPDDLDDTSLALAALYLADKNIVNEAYLAQITKILINSEEKTGGPYHTWVMPNIRNTKWANVDLAVNANIGFSLSLLKIKLAGVESLIDSAITNKKFESPYYYSENAVIYFISRFYQGPKKPDLIKFLLEKNSKPYLNPLECALLGISLLNLGIEPEGVKTNLEYMQTNQSSDGSFGIFPFVNERLSKNSNRISGCDSFTTALSLEFMARYTSLSHSKLPKKDYLEFEQHRDDVLAHALQIIKKKYHPGLYSQFHDYLSDISQAKDSQEIVLHPFLFLRSLKIPFSLDRNKKFLLDLATASILGWVSYTIFDNVVDENKDKDKISLAIICNRELEQLFCQKNHGFEEIFRNIIARVDYANFFEFKYSTMGKDLSIPKFKIYPNPDFIADKSIAHCLTPLAILYKLGFSQHSREFIKVISFYQNYLTARQLNDDAHDWEEDLARGQINYVGEMLLKDYKDAHKTSPDILNDKLKIRLVFWNKTIMSVCELIQAKINAARSNLKTIDDFIQDDFLKARLENLEGAAEKAISERQKTIDYISALFSKQLEN